MNENEKFIIIIVKNLKLILFIIKMNRILKAEQSGATDYSDFVERSVAGSERKILYGFSIQGRNFIEEGLQRFIGITCPVGVKKSGLSLNIRESYLQNTALF